MDTRRFPHHPLRLLGICLLLFLVSCSLAAGPMGTNATTSRAASSAMFGVDAEHTHFTSNEHIITYANASRLVPDWTSFATGGSIFSSPVVVGGMVFIGSLDGRLYAFSAAGCGKASCQPLWASTSMGDRIFSSPAVAGGVVFIGSDDGSLYAFDETGCGSPPCSPLWVSPPTGDAVYSSPAVTDGVVYAGSLDHKLYAFHLHGTIP
jgi:outer membrane protein assembly factor BamB